MEDVSNAIVQIISSCNPTNPRNVYLVPTKQFVLGSIILLPKQVTTEFPMIQLSFILAQIRMLAFKAIKLNL